MYAKKEGAEEQQAGEAPPADDGHAKHEGASDKADDEPDDQPLDECDRMHLLGTLKHVECHQAEWRRMAERLRYR